MIRHSACLTFCEESIDTILADSFPASDPPPWTLGRENTPFSESVDNSSERIMPPTDEES